MIKTTTLKLKVKTAKPLFELLSFFSNDIRFNPVKYINISTNDSEDVVLINKEFEMMILLAPRMEAY